MSEEQKKELVVLLDAEKNGNLTESGKKYMKDIRDTADQIMMISIALRLITKCVDPYGKKHTIASLFVGGSLRDFPFLNSNQASTELGYLIRLELSKGKNTISRNIADLSIVSPVFNKQEACLESIVRFYFREGYWPTKKELSVESLKQYPEQFQNFDEKEWRRLRKSLCIEWLEDGKRGIKRGGKKK